MKKGTNNCKTEGVTVNEVPRVIKSEDDKK